jgi:acyl-CoA hydrolase
MSSARQGDPRAIYESKKKSLDEAAALIQPADTIAVPIATGQPTALLNALGKRDDFTELLVFSALFIQPYALLQKPGVRVVSGFFGPIERMLKNAGARIDYLPADFLGWERYARLVPPRVMASAVAPMDDQGFLNFGLHAGATFHAFVEAARDPNRLAIAEVNPSMPHVYGIARCGGHRIHISEVDCVVESDDPIFELPPEPVTDVDRAIAEHVERLIDNGATLQIGIGGVPNLVAQMLASGKKGDFGIHTEMLVDGIMHLHEAGKVTNHKGVFDGYSVATFCAGSKRLYEWVHRNPEVRMLPVSYVNDPAIIRRNRSMVSINGALAVDLTGQVMADTIGPRQYSGVGGHELFVIGAHDSPGGKSLICMHSTANASGERVSTIVPAFPSGTPVTTPRHHVQYVVTEYGAVNLSLLPDRERASALAEIAHPDYREELRAYARARFGTA